MVNIGMDDLNGYNARNKQELLKLFELINLNSFKETMHHTPGIPEMNGTTSFEFIYLNERCRTSRIPEAIRFPLFKCIGRNDEPHIRDH